MKFVSKNVNLCVVLRPSIPAEPLAGRTATPGVYARFENGILTVNDEAMITLLKNHSSFNRDFVAVEEAEEAQIASYLANQRSKEPEHDMITMEYGHPGKNLNPRPKVVLTPEVKQVLAQTAAQMAKDMAAEMTKSAKEEIAKLREELLAAKEPLVKEEKKLGRPKKVEAVGAPAVTE